jgi:uncharacterized protein (UPF0335 family)
MPKATLDAIALLKADHRRVEELFAKYPKARGKKAEIAKQICQELTIHTIIEEEIFYPACRGVVEDDKLEEAFVEHDGAKMLIAELESGTPGDDFFDAKVRVLCEEIRHHVKEEEKRGGVFSQAKSSGLDLAALGQQLAVRKKDLKTQIEEEGLPPPTLRTMIGGKVEHRQISL